MRTKILGLALLLPCLTGCANPPPGGPVESPYLIDLTTGDRMHLAERQMGLSDEEPPRVAVEGDFPLAGARVACGPAGAGAHPAFRLEIIATGGEALALTLVVPDFHAAADPEGRPAEATLARVGADGSYLESTGTARVRLEAPGHSAGNFHASGSFTAEVAGEAGDGSLSGTFAECYYFT